MRASTPKQTSPDPSLLTPPHTRRMPRECRAPVLGTGTRASTKGSMAAASRILEEEVSNDPPRANRSNRRATLDIRALNVNSVGDKDTPDLGDVEPFLTHVTKDFVDNDFDSRVDIIHEAITEIELNASPGAPPEDRRFSVANHPGVKVDLDRWISVIFRGGSGRSVQLNL
ncbi:hypothetical protein E4U37_008347, partial [Claviceps purpurea]